MVVGICSTLGEFILFSLFSSVTFFILCQAPFFKRKNTLSGVVVTYRNSTILFIILFLSLEFLTLCNRLL